MRKTEYKITEKSIPLAIAVGAGISFAVMMLGALMIALLLMNQTIEEGATGYGVMITIILAAAAGCGTTVMIARNRILILSICTGLVFAMSLLGITALFFDGQYSGVAPTILVIVGSTVGVALIAGKYLNRPKTYRKKR